MSFKEMLSARKSAPPTASEFGASMAELESDLREFVEKEGMSAKKAPVKTAAVRTDAVEQNRRAAELMLRQLRTIDAQMEENSTEARLKQQEAEDLLAANEILAVQRELAQYFVDGLVPAEETSPDTPPEEPVNLPEETS